MTSQQSRGSPAVPADRSATPSPQLVVELIDLLERLLVDRRVPQVRTAVTHTRAQTHTDSRRQTESGASIMPFKQVARHHATAHALHLPPLNILFQHVPPPLLSAPGGPSGPYRLPSTVKTIPDARHLWMPQGRTLKLATNFFWSHRKNKNKTMFCPNTPALSTESERTPRDARTGRATCHPRDAPEPRGPPRARPPRNQASLSRRSRWVARRLLPPAAAPAMPQQGGGGMMSGIMGGVVQGMAFGTGSQLAGRALDSVMGARQVEHVHTNAPAEAAAAPGEDAAIPACPAHCEARRQTQSCDYMQPGSRVHARCCRLEGSLQTAI